MPVELADVPFTSVDESLERLERFVSPAVGIVSHVVTSTVAADDARLVHTACQVASSIRTAGEQSPEYSGGAHPSASRARAAAIGEAIERYCGACAPTQGAVSATADGLAGDAVAPERFALFHERQFRSHGFPFVRFTPATRLRFVEAVALDDGRSCFVPAQLVYLGPPGVDESPVAYSTSSGLACGATFDEAVLAGLLELVERDAVMIAWKNRLSLPLLDWSRDERLEALDRAVFRPTGLRYDVLDGSAFADVPVAIGVVHGPPGEGTALAMGGGAAATIGEAWLKALAEAFSVHRWLARETLEDPSRCDVDANDVRTFDDHMLFYAGEQRARLAAFLVASTRRTPTSSVVSIRGSTPRAQVQALLGRLAAREASAYAVDVTTPEVAAEGLCVVRVIAPELCPLDVVHLAPFLGGTRLYEAAHEAGLTPAPLSFEGLNPHPHPFP